MVGRIKLCALLTFVYFLTLTKCDLGTDLAARIAPDTSPDVQEDAAKQLIQRVIGLRASQWFQVEVNRILDPSSYQISRLDNGKVLITGSNGVSVCKGFHYYLKFVLKKDFDWFKTHIELPEDWDPPNVTHRSKSSSPLIYYQNPCVWSYSFVWWQFDEWRRHIDWMAMMGINLVIAPNQETIWQDVYTELGLTPQEIEAHFAGPAFQAWQRMGNLRSWGGPLPPAHRQLQQLLQQRILAAQRELGMSVALPAFSGYVPTAMRRVFPNASFTQSDRWNHFPDPYCCVLFVEPQDPLFQQVGAMFLRRVIQVYGSNHIYFSDPFNEMMPRVREPNYVRYTAKAIYNSMQVVDADAVWLIQGWMFLKSVYWTNDLIEAYLTAVPRGRILALDLQSEQFPQYERTHSYYGQPFVWCMLNNFGGNLGLFGSAQLIPSGIIAARSMPNGSMVGVGITPEGIGQNYALFALTLEQAWSPDELQLEDWFEYFALTRYGVNDTRLSQVWQLLRESVYSFQGRERMRGKYTLNKRPSLHHYPWVWYNVTMVYEAWRLMLEAKETVPLNDNRRAIYEHDLVDITRQCLQLSFDRFYVNLKSACRHKQLNRVEYLAGKLLELFADMERILASGEHYLLGNWLEAAKRLAPSEEQRPIYEFNARNQLTSWGPNYQIPDYATKQWSGLMSDYFQPRWNMFLEAVIQALKTQTPFNYSEFKQRVENEIELPFSNHTKAYPTSPVGSTWNISHDIYEKWNAYSRDTLFLNYCQIAVTVAQTQKSGEEEW
ncbi:uncharacterized protein Dmoj_GI17241 [Drosophila mojavensis]|uniref:Alpha-N-acetylglucosaminidase n=1 Tax=Drosophila mojavensis TaxID=7230 RepID=B4KKH5_DROMO|nr:uncharacterized protein Dmoj_GI17241 [Drosophila mojavensis]